MLEHGTSLQALYKYGKDILIQAGIDDARTDAWLLMEHVMGISRSYYFVHREDEADPVLARQYTELVKKRSAHTPLQYLTGEAWFYGNCFFVSPDVLIPRQDTENLVEEAERHLQSGMRILDMCTGSGCILLSLLKNHPDVSGTGTDLSDSALAVARINRSRLHVSEDRAAFFQGNLFDAVPPDMQFDMILSNPPYIASDVIPALDPEVRDHEPRLALDGRNDGLFFEEKIAEAARQYFHADRECWLFLEIGYDQGMKMCESLKRLGYANVRILKDFGGNDRIACGSYRIGQKGVI
ncbi:MAG: peptide chain release factor N(5)-glutamine methyltransferase [Eubacterium sp.]|nr:peptide chain release factor N(5)-glutamine methyltransferase [Eubacterium sp.]